MARSSEAAFLTGRHRALQLAVRSSTLRDLLALWGVVDPTNLSGTMPGFARSAATLAALRRRDSAAAAARYFREFRRLEGVPGVVAIVLPEPPSIDTLEPVVRAAALAGVTNARQRGLDVEPAARNGFVKASGAVSSLVLGGGRSVLLGAIDSDRAALGWQRATSGEPCAFCRMLASRGAAYKAQGSADFQAHDHCSCVPEPLYEGSRPLPLNERFRAHWEETTRGLDGRDALNAFRQAVGTH